MHDRHSCIKNSYAVWPKFLRKGCFLHQVVSLVVSLIMWCCRWFQIFRGAKRFFMGGIILIGDNFLGGWKLDVTDSRWYILEKNNFVTLIWLSPVERNHLQKQEVEGCEGQRRYEKGIDQSHRQSNWIRIHEYYRVSW